MELFNDDQVRTFMIQVAAPIMLIALGLGILMGAKRANYSQVLSTTGIAIIGVMFIVAAGLMMNFGERLATFLFG